jgi:hypothetical protein
LEQSTLVPALTLRDDRTARPSLGKARGKDGDDHYASLQEAPGVFVLSDATYKTLTEALAKLGFSGSFSAALTRMKA